MGDAKRKMVATRQIATKISLMISGEISVIHNSPSVEDFNKLRAAVGWGTLNSKQIMAGFSNSLFAVHAVIAGETIGCARIVGDGAIYFYIQDMMILPQYQRSGVGSKLLAALMGFLEKAAPENSFIGLMAAAGAAPFYEKHGIPQRKPDCPGMGAWKGKDWPGKSL